MNAAEMKAYRNEIARIGDSPRTSEENWMDVRRWTERTDEDHREGVQILLLNILEKHGTQLLNYASANPRAISIVARELKRRHMPNVDASRIIAALNRWTRGEENVSAMRKLGIILGEIPVHQKSTAIARKTV